jgi:hypothetical protein
MLGFGYVAWQKFWRVRGESPRDFDRAGAALKVGVIHLPALRANSGTLTERDSDLVTVDAMTDADLGLAARTLLFDAADESPIFCVGSGGLNGIGSALVGLDNPPVNRPRCRPAESRWRSPEAVRTERRNKFNRRSAPDGWTSASTPIELTPASNARSRPPRTRCGRAGASSRIPPSAAPTAIFPPLASDTRWRGWSKRALDHQAAARDRRRRGHLRPCGHAGPCLADRRPHRSTQRRSGRGALHCRFAAGLAGGRDPAQGRSGGRAGPIRDSARLGKRFKSRGAGHLSVDRSAKPDAFRNRANFAHIITLLQVLRD